MLLKESFLEVYTHERVEEAKECLENWIKQALSSGLDVFIQLGYKCQEKMKYILNWFYKSTGSFGKVSFAISEGFNNKIKRLKSPQDPSGVVLRGSVAKSEDPTGEPVEMAYGYKDINYFRLKIHQSCPRQIRFWRTLRFIKP
ncbi:MAG TPA: transposase [bacterium]|nr:transposase [bacterium]